MVEDEKIKKYFSGFGDKVDEVDLKMFVMGEINCLVYLLKKLIQVLNFGEEVLFQRFKRKFFLNDEIWFDRVLFGVNSLGNMMKEIFFVVKLS